MRFLGTIVIMLMLGAAARGQTVRLMAHAEANDAVVRLGAIATIEDATPAVRERLAQTVIIPQLAGQKAVGAEEILYAVLQQNQDLALASTLVIRGAARCTVVLEGAPADTVPVAIGAPAAVPAVSAGEYPLANRAGSVTGNAEAVVAAPAAQGAYSNAGATPASPGSAALPAALIPGSLAEMITTQTQKEFKLTAADLEVKFTNGDPAIFAATPAGRKWAFHATMGRSLGTMQWEATLMQDNAPVKDIWVQATLRQRMVQLVCTADIERGSILAADMLTVQTAWVDRQTNDIATDPKEMIGMQANRPMAAGTPINRRDFQMADVISSGDVVTVYFIRDGLRVKTTAKAQTQARFHQTVRIESENKQVYEATAIGERLAVVGDVDPATEKELRETK